MSCRLFRGRRPKRTNRTAGAITGWRPARQPIAPGRVVKIPVIRVKAGIQASGQWDARQNGAGFRFGPALEW